MIYILIKLPELLRKLTGAAGTMMYSLHLKDRHLTKAEILRWASPVQYYPAACIWSHRRTLDGERESTWNLTLPVFRSSQLRVLTSWHLSNLRGCLACNQRWTGEKTRNLGGQSSWLTAKAARGCPSINGRCKIIMLCRCC